MSPFVTRALILQVSGEGPSRTRLLKLSSTRSITTRSMSKSRPKTGAWVAGPGASGGGAGAAGFSSPISAARSLAASLAAFSASLAAFSASLAAFSSASSSRTSL